MSKRMDWRKAGLAGKPTAPALDGGLLKEPKTKAQKRRAARREKAKLYGFYHDKPPGPVRHIKPEDWKPQK